MRNFYLLLAGLCLLTFSAQSQTTRILFLGNSYTNNNDLPGMVQNLSISLGDSVFRPENAPGGY